MQNNPVKYQTLRDVKTQCHRTDFEQTSFGNSNNFVNSNRFLSGRLEIFLSIFVASNLVKIKHYQKKKSKKTRKYGYHVAVTDHMNESCFNMKFSEYIAWYRNPSSPAVKIHRNTASVSLILSCDDMEVTLANVTR